jgi:hypothetical protein
VFEGTGNGHDLLFDFLQDCVDQGMIKELQYIQTSTIRKFNYRDFRIFDDLSSKVIRCFYSDEKHEKKSTNSAIASVLMGPYHI